MSDAHQKLSVEYDPLTEDERWIRAADWSDYKKAYGADSDPVKLARYFQMYCAGWDAGRRSGGVR